ncbi:MAG: tetratricopeptide repeat protein [Pseudomonadota bacterium]
MKDKGSKFVHSLIVTTVVLLFGFAVGYAQISEETYSRAVRQLNADGYAGIDKALQVFEELIQKDPDFIKGYISAADAYLLKYEFEEKKNRQWLDRAVTYLNTAAGKETQNPAIYFKRAVIQFNLEQPEKAVGDLQTAMGLAPNYLDARLLYLQYLLSLNRRAEAREFVDGSIKLFSNDPAPLRYLADVVFAGGDNEKAVELYQTVVKLVPEAPNTYLALGKAHLNLKQYPLAIASFQKALSQSPELADAHFSLAIAYGETGRLKEAVSQMETYIQKVPKDAAALNNLALLYEQTGETTRARLTWLKLKEAAPDKAYQERADQHLQALSAQAAKQASPPLSPKASPAKRGKK